MNFALLSYGSAAVAYAAVGVHAQVRRHTEASLRFVCIAAYVTSLWAACLCLSTIRPTPPWIVACIDTLRYVAWFATLHQLVGRQLPAWLRHGSYFLCAVFLAATAFPGQNLVSLIGLMLSLCGLLLVEQLIRNAAPAQRRMASFAAVSIGGQFAYDLFLYSQSQLLGGMSATAWAVRGLALLLLVPSLVLAVRALSMTPAVLFVSRHVVFYTSSFLAVGAYLCLMALGGYYVRLHGGSWGGALQIIFLCGAAVVLASLLLIDAPWRRLRVFIATHFYRNKYDYRVEWLRFVQTLSAGGDGDAHRSAISAVAHIIGSDGGFLLLQNSAHTDFVAVASWPEELGSLDQRLVVARGDDLANFLRQKRWVIDLKEYARQPALYRNIALPDWLSGGPLQIVVPLLLGNELLGMLVLRQPPAPFEMSFEDRDLLKTVGRHVAIQIAQRRADDKLAEEQQFSAYHRFAAFVMHDLKNSVAQLQLLVNNATRHRHNPAFMDDAISTIANTAERMTRLIEQLQSRETQGQSRDVDLAALVRAAAVRGQGRDPAVGIRGELVRSVVKADSERLASVLDHVIRNAQDATGQDGTVELQLLQQGGLAELVVTDTGKGMDPEFIRHRLFRPFDTTKGSKGMGIGAYQAREYVRSLGGDVEVQSNPGQGTRFYIRLKLCPE